MQISFNLSVKYRAINVDVSLQEDRVIMYECYSTGSTTRQLKVLLQGNKNMHKICQFMTATRQTLLNNNNN